MDQSFIRYLFLFLLSFTLLSVAFFIQYLYDLPPCLICITQRFLIGLLGVSALFFLYKKPKLRHAKCIAGIWITLLSLIGLGLAARHIYLEAYPDASETSCLPGFEYLFQILPWFDLLKALILGGPSCSIVPWRFLMLSMAEWLVFVFLITGWIGCLEWKKYTKLS
ncbi:MAG: disulfide bond formation protein B [Endozoicomonadaceae bacterium]|nr:disulfide bond formation protein B [Endozoicomonadaceae bacterium]